MFNFKCFKTKKNLSPAPNKEKKHISFFKFKKKKKKVLIKKSYGSDTDTELDPWFRFLVLKPGFGRILVLPILKSRDLEY